MIVLTFIITMSYVSKESKLYYSITNLYIEIIKNNENQIEKDKNYCGCDKFIRIIDRKLKKTVNCQLGCIYNLH